ncbi:DUF3873 domain-containing protein [Phocaeicola vulgatus]|uniref:DUF3873 domain-containing protein n=1 Tax=Phocaeicola vulgatus TaxID=821 RepID=UPI001E2C3C2F|nr:DUF3873 domain-containing protein [Phocaeicola vulgatus]
MSTRMTINGVSTCQTAGTEKYESFQLGYGRKRRTLVQYDYRHHTDGELFSCVKPTLEECRNERDKWLNKYNPQIEMFARFKMKSSFHKTKRII